MIVPKSHKYGTLPCNPKPNFSYDENGKMYQSSPIGNDCEIPEGLDILKETSMFFCEKTFPARINKALINNDRIFLVYCDRLIY
jgi:hypothetical protein